MPDFEPKQYLCSSTPRPTRLNARSSRACCGATFWVHPELTGREKPMVPVRPRRIAGGAWRSLTLAPRPARWW
jgi:hypothetical protein